MLSTTFLESKEEILKVKNDLVEKLRVFIKNRLQEKIKKNHSNYIKFLISKIKQHIEFIDKPPKIVILFNSKDFDYFKKNINKIKNLFKNSIEIKKNPDEFIGGFKAILANGNISFDYSIEYIQNENLSLIQQEFSKIISDSKIKEIETNFENYIRNKKIGIEDYLVSYDRI